MATKVRFATKGEIIVEYGNLPCIEKLKITQRALEMMELAVINDSLNAICMAMGYQNSIGEINTWNKEVEL